MPTHDAAHAAARKAIDVLTGSDGDLGPSTRDLLTLDGLATAGEWTDEQEAARMVDVILSEYEAVAVERDDRESIRAIIALRVEIEPLYRGSPWDEQRCACGQPLEANGEHSGGYGASCG